MADYETYRQQFEKAEMYFNEQITDRMTKAYDYGVLVVKNAVLIAGGGLLAIPAITGLASDFELNVINAIRGGIAFAVALGLSIVACYVIHINWALNHSAWEKYWGDRQEYLPKVYLDGVSHDEAVVTNREHHARAIALTFYLPHLLAIAYLIAIFIGFWNLYSAFGVTP